MKFNSLKIAQNNAAFSEELSSSAETLGENTVQLEKLMSSSGMNDENTELRK